MLIAVCTGCARRLRSHRRARLSRPPPLPRTGTPRLRAFACATEIRTPAVQTDHKGLTCARSAPMRALVGPCPVYSRSTWTAAREMSAWWRRGKRWDPASSFHPAGAPQAPCHDSLPSPLTVAPTAFAWRRRPRRVRRGAWVGRGPGIRRRAIRPHRAPASVESSSRAATIAFHAIRHSEAAHGRRPARCSFRLLARIVHEARVGASGASGGAFCDVSAALRVRLGDEGRSRGNVGAHREWRRAAVDVAAEPRVVVVVEGVGAV
jgi:hypothetical protein